MIKEPYAVAATEYRSRLQRKSGVEYNWENPKQAGWWGAAGVYERNETRHSMFVSRFPKIAQECEKVSSEVQKREDIREEQRYRSMKMAYLKSGIKKLFLDFCAMPAAIFIALNSLLYPIGVWLRDGIKQDRK